MNKILRHHTDIIVTRTLAQVLPDHAVKEELTQHPVTGKHLYIVAIGKAAWQMAAAAREVLGSRITDGIVITKYHHVQGDLTPLRCREAGHPVPDANSYTATREAVDMVSHLSEDDTVLFLVSGGGSALFELPLLPPEETEDLTNQMLACGASITEINTIRKRLSAVKGGKFAQIVAPAHIRAIVLSDILGDPLDMIASGPAYPDSSTCEDALKIVHKYSLRLSTKALELLRIETPKQLDHVETTVTGSVRNLCQAAADVCRELGYTPLILTDRLSCQAREAGRFLGAIGRFHEKSNTPLAFLAGGETIVKLEGTGLGGRNQELALAAAAEIAGCPNIAVFSLGSDGTDGPTDAAGGYADGDTVASLQEQNIDLLQMLQNNDSYHALQAVDGLLVTGPTGTNVNDVSVVLIR